MIGAMNTTNSIDPQEFPAIATPKDIERILGIPQATLAQDRYLKRGLPYTKIGNRVRYLRADILAYLHAHRAEMRD